MDARQLFLTNNSILQSRLQKICSDPTDEQVRFAHEAVDDRGLSNVVIHLYGSVMNRARAILGQEREPAPELPQTTAELMTFINESHVKAEGLIGQITDAQLEAVVKLPFAELPGATAMLDSYAHAFRHVGNVLDARHLGGFETHALG